MNTYMAKPGQVDQKWVLIDADGQVLGRVASRVASILRGKDKPEFTPYVDVGDRVIVINAEKVVLTGKKLEQKVYRRHSGYPGGMKVIGYKDLMQKNPQLVMYLAVKRMLPKNKLGRKMLKKLRVYRDAAHKHDAQKPTLIKL